MLLLNVGEIDMLNFIIGIGIGLGIAAVVVVIAVIVVKSSIEKSIGNFFGW